MTYTEATLWIHEHNMNHLLDRMFPGYEFLHDKGTSDLGLKTRPDYRCKDLKLIFEYDGPRHYTESSKCLQDITKRQAYRDLGYKVIEWPYFIQPSTSVLKEMGFDFEIEQTYPHGFNEEGVVMPADFCYLGIERFKRELKIYKNEVEEIKKSLKKKDINPLLLLPEPLLYLLN